MPTISINGTRWDDMRASERGRSGRRNLESPKANWQKKNEKTAEWRFAFLKYIVCVSLRVTIRPSVHTAKVTMKPFKITVTDSLVSKYEHRMHWRRRIVRFEERSIENFTQIDGRRPTIARPKKKCSNDVQLIWLDSNFTWDESHQSVSASSGANVWVSRFGFRHVVVEWHDALAKRKETVGSDLLAISSGDSRRSPIVPVALKMNRRMKLNKTPTADGWTSVVAFLSAAISLNRNRRQNEFY